jgi:hypothetical protein
MAQRHHNARHNDNNYWFLRLNRLAQEMRIERNDYLHLDMYLWLEADVNIVANLLMNPNLGALARRQECLFLELLDHLHPQDVLCLYPRVGNRIYQLCQRNLMGFWREGNWQLVPNTPLCQVTIYRLGNQQPITLFKPVGRPIPNGAWAMANQVFEDVRRFFHNRYAN